MSSKTLQKVVVASLDLSDGSDLDFEDPQTLPDRLLEKYKSTQGHLDISFDDQRVLLRWRLDKVDGLAEALHQEALAFVKQGRYQEAIEKWSRASAINPHDPDYLFHLGIAYFETKNYQLSAENLQKAVQLCPIHHKAHLILGTVYIKARKHDLAEHHIRESIRLSPSNPLAYLNLGAVYSMRRNYEKGIAMFQKAIALSPQEARAYLGLAKIYSILGESGKANEYFRKVIEYDKKGVLANYAKKAMVTERGVAVAKGSVERYYADGYRLFLAGHYADAVQCFQNYLSIKPEDDYVWFSLGEAQMRAGKADAAAVSFRKAIRINPKKGLYYKEYGIALDLLNRPKDVIEVMQRAIDFGKKDTLTYGLWGKSLVQEGKYSEAIVILEQALKLDRNNILARYYLALALAKNEELDLALDHLAQIQNLPPTVPLKQQVEKLLAALSSAGPLPS